MDHCIAEVLKFRSVASHSTHGQLDSNHLRGLTQVNWLSTWFDSVPAGLTYVSI